MIILSSPVVTRIYKLLAYSLDSGSWEEWKDAHDWSAGLELEIFKPVIGQNPNASRLQLPEMSEYKPTVVISDLTRRRTHHYKPTVQ